MLDLLGWPPSTSRTAGSSSWPDGLLPQQVERDRRPGRIPTGTRTGCTASRGRWARPASPTGPTSAAAPSTSVNAIFDPKFKGKVTILDEMRDSVGLTMLGMGNDPTTGGIDQENAAVAKIGAARDAGQFRKITGNDYTEDLQLGDTWICHGLVGRHRQPQGGQPRPGRQDRVLHPDPGRHDLRRQRHDPGRGQEPQRGGGVHELRLRPEGRGAAVRGHQLRLAGAGRGRLHERRRQARASTSTRPRTRSSTSSASSRRPRTRS